MQNDETTTPDYEQDDNQIIEADETEEKETPAEAEVDWKAEALKYKAILARNKEKGGERKQEKREEKTDGFGYDVKAYLKASGIHADEFDFVKAELKRAGGDIDSLIENEYFRAKLERHREQNKTADASIKGKRTGNVATDSVDYWMTKPFEEVPMDMRRKVLAEREKREANKGKFYNS